MHVILYILCETVSYFQFHCTPILSNSVVIVIPVSALLEGINIGKFNSHSLA